MCIRDRLSKLGVAYQEIDILQDAEGAEEMVRRSGQRHVPTLILPDGAVLVEPDNLTLLQKVMPLAPS